MVAVAACQVAVADLDPGANVETITERIAGLPDRVELAVFPEYALTGFVADARARAAALDARGPELAAVADAAADADVAVVVGFLEDAGDALHNGLAYLTPDGDRTVYRKRHLWANEAELVTPGEARVTVDTPVGTAGLLTCYDLNFVAESAAFADPPVDALLVGGAWPGEHGANWDLLVRARALDGVRWVVAAGRTGEKDVPGESGGAYAGRSAAVRPDGVVAGRIARGERDLVCDLDPAVLADQRDLVGSV